MTRAFRTARCIVCGLALASQTDALQIQNPGFETGDLSGWTVSGWGGGYWDGDGYFVDYPFDSKTNPHFGKVPNVKGSAALNGAYGLYIEPWQGWGEWINGPDGNPYWFEARYYGVTVSQLLWMDAGETLQGWARFGSEDGSPWANDFARVTVNGLEIWAHNCSEFPGLTHEYRWMPWEAWSFTAAQGGYYNLAFSVYGDDQFNTYASFDMGIPVADAGTSLTLLTLGFGGIAFLRRRLKR